MQFVDMLEAGLQGRSSVDSYARGTRVCRLLGSAVDVAPALRNRRREMGLAFDECDLDYHTAMFPAVLPPTCKLLLLPTAGDGPGV